MRAGQRADRKVCHWADLKAGDLADHLVDWTVGQ